MKTFIWSLNWNKFRNNSPFKIAFYYFLFSFFWILLSDHAISLVAITSHQLTTLQTFKGWLYTTGTTFLIFFLVRGEIRKKNRLISLLNESNKWYNLMIKNVPNIDVLLVDRNKQVIIAQGNTLQKLGWLSSDVQNKYLSGTNIDKDLYHLLSKDFGDVVEGKFKNSKFEKEEFYLEIAGVPVYSDHQELIAGLFVIIDNTSYQKGLHEISRQRNEYEVLYKKYLEINNKLKKSNLEIIDSYNKISESEEKYRMFFENINDAAAILELRHDTRSVRFVEVNERLALPLGYTPDELKGKEAQKILEEPPNVFMNRLDTVLQEKKLRFETVYLTRNGEGIPFEVSIYLVQNDASDLFYIIARNISDQKKYITELKIAKEQAESADKLKTSFLSNISHEIRTPLNGILGFSEILADDTLPVEKRIHYNQVVRNSGEQLLSLFRDILDLSQIESGQYQFSYAFFSKNELCADIEEDLHQAVLKSRKDLKFFFNKKLSLNDKCYGDKNALLRIASIVIDNAVKYTKDGQIMVGFYGENEERITMIFEDTGIGVPKEGIPHMFDRFRKIDEGREYEYGGLGIGLSIVKGLLDLLKGSINIVSPNDGGLRVKIDFPMPQDIQLN